LFFTVEANAALVTGGAGIAAEIARRMLKASYEIIVLDRRNPEWTNMRLHADELDLLEADAVLLVRLSGATALAISFGSNVHDAAYFAGKLPARA
jgi:NAD(P)-dependent dehydrogenase (short-subunit alcohol dehydrogenase family)